MKNSPTRFYCIVLFVSTLLVSCNSNPTQNTGIDTKKSESDTTYNICYSSFVKKDTVLLNALMYGDSIKGSLGYKLYEKDRNNGTILGRMYGDTLRALYTFMSEGVESTRQVIFLKHDSLLIEGVGDLKEENGRVIFDNVNSVEFEGIVLVQSDCK